MPIAKSEIDLTATLLRFNACQDALDWCHGKNPEDAWRTCERGDWMLWIVARVDVDRKIIVHAACQCARLALKYVPVEENRPLIAIETAEAWCRGEATIEDVRRSRVAAYVYADAVYDDSHTAADAAAADAAAAASSHTAADAAADAAAYTADAAAADARQATLSKCADLVRETIAFSVISNAAAYAAAADAAAAAVRAAAAYTADAAAADARQATLSKCADLVRETIAFSVISKSVDNFG